MICNSHTYLYMHFLLYVPGSICRVYKTSKDLTSFKYVRGKSETINIQHFYRPFYSPQDVGVQAMVCVIERLISFSVKSNLLTVAQVHTIGNWLKETRKFGRYKACWSTSMRLYKYESFYSYCGYTYNPSYPIKKNTVTIFRLIDDNRVLGGFTGKFFFYLDLSLSVHAE